MVPEVTLTLFRKIAGALEVPLGGRLTERQNRTRRGSGSAPAPREKPAAAPIRGGSPLFGRWREPRNCSRLRPSPSVEVSPGVALKVAARVRIPLGVLAKALQLQGFLRYRALVGSCSSKIGNPLVIPRVTVEPLDSDTSCGAATPGG